MRDPLFVAIALFGLVSGAPSAFAAAKPSAPAIAVKTTPAPTSLEEAWHSEVAVMRSSWEFVEDISRLGNGGWSYSGWSAWIDLQQIPADLKSKPVNMTVKLALSLDAQGKPTACSVQVPSEDASLNDLACASLLRNARFDAPYSKPGISEPSKVNISVRLNTMTKADWEAALARRLPAVATPKPVHEYPEYSSWPRLKWEGGLYIDRFPNLQSLFPVAAGKAEGRTSLELVVDGRTGAVECRIGVSSVNAALDQASCEIGRSLPLRYPKLCLPCDTRYLPLQFVWQRKKGSHIRIPLPDTQQASSWDAPLLQRDPADSRIAKTHIVGRKVLGQFVPGDVMNGVVAPEIKSRRVQMRLTVDLDGKPNSCVTTWASGSAVLDANLCKAVLAKVRYSIIEDIFRDPAGSGDAPIMLTVNIAP